MRIQRMPVSFTEVPVPHATRTDPKSYKPAAMLMMRFRPTMLSPPWRSLYIQVRPNSREVSSHAPNNEVTAKMTGIETSNSVRICVGVSRPEGPGRHGLFIRSSATEIGSRWLALAHFRVSVSTSRCNFGEYKGRNSFEKCLTGRRRLYLANSRHRRTVCEPKRQRN